VDKNELEVYVGAVQASMQIATARVHVQIKSTNGPIFDQSTYLIHLRNAPAHKNLIRVSAK
jgi:hypothetical protein